jgi:3-keto-5-aminohexanoate cleavage enzyme
MFDDLIVNFIPTGMIPTKELSPFVPITPSEIIEQVHEANELGITLVHLHARESDGQPTYKSSTYSEIIDGIKKHCPQLVVCTSLSGRKFQELEKRTEVVSLKPDMASLTMGSLNFPKQASPNSPETILELIEAMNKFGVNPELECFDSGMVNYAKVLIGKELLKPPYYFNIIFGNVASVQADPAYAGLLLKDLPANCYWSFGGIGVDQLKMNALAIAFNGGVRVGIEDNIWFDNERKELASNIRLLKRVHQLGALFGRKIMPSSDFGKLGFYNRISR